MSFSQIPNLLTLSRIALTPVVVVLLLQGRFLRALAVFAAAGVTDALDGWLARGFGWSSRAGAYLDPIADKLLLSAVYITLGIVSAVPWWLVGIIFGRDLLILAGAGIAMSLAGRRDFSPSVWGKISTVLQIVTAVAAMAHHVRPRVGLKPGVEVLVYTAAVATAWSGLHYLWRVAQPPPARPRR